MPVKLNLQNAGFREHELDYVRPLAEAASMLLAERTGQGTEMLGWLDLPILTTKRSLPVSKPRRSVSGSRVRCS